MASARDILVRTLSTSRLRGTSPSGMLRRGTVRSTPPHFPLGLDPRSSRVRDGLGRECERWRRCIGPPDLAGILPGCDLGCGCFFCPTRGAFVPHAGLTLPLATGCDASGIGGRRGGGRWFLAPLQGAAGGDALLVRRGSGGSRCCAPSPPAIVLSPFQGGGRRRTGALWGGRITRRVMNTVLVDVALPPTAAHGDPAPYLPLHPAPEGQKKSSRGCSEARAKPPVLRITQSASKPKRPGGAREGCRRSLAWGERHHSESDEYCTGGRGPSSASPHFLLDLNSRPSRVRDGTTIHRALSAGCFLLPHFPYFSLPLTAPPPSRGRGSCRAL
ncbi:hypothetical protein HNQ64_001709 [Prosthecobacter dejongeii]|uniref:Uncharacterized protein n=1 Tax=Prosthecobacter dejongeii TaxID=48465 RepID=A0A7W8DPS0_9BACT|nr:hypothetical protein [Prosthecobacter dejongeii]